MRSRSAILVWLALLVLACGERADRAGAGEAAEPVFGGTLVIAGPNDLDRANSLVSGERYTQELLRYALFLPLIQYGPDLSFLPRLAESWELLGDTGVVFRLRRDVRWHDGAPTTAYDVAFTYERAIDPATAYPNSDHFANYRGVVLTDSFTVRFRFEPHADPLAPWPFVPIMPRHLLEGVAAAQLRNAPFNKSPVGNGPFRFVSYQPNDRWVLEANREFPAALGGRPYLDRVVWRIIPEQTAQLAEVRSGTADVVLAPPTAQFRALDASPQLRGIVSPSRQFIFLGWNAKRPQFQDARVRRALAMAIDAQEILTVLRSGLGERAVGPIGSFHWAYHRGLQPLPFDTQAARALLDSAAIRDQNGDGVRELAGDQPFRFELKIAAGNEYQANVAEMILADLAAVGVQITVRPTEFATLIGDLMTPERRFDAVLMGWESDFRLNVRDNFHSAAYNGPFQLASYRNPEVDSLIDQASRTVSREAAIPLWHRFQEILRLEQPWTVLFYYPDVYVVNERVKGTDMDIRGAFVNLPRWWLAPSAPAASGPATDTAPAN